MKKIFVSIVLLVIVTTSVANAQSPQGGQRASQMMEMLKQRMKDELKLTDVKADSVVAISREFQPKMREVRMDQNLSNEEKKKQIDAITEARKKRWKSAGLTEEEVKSVGDFFENMQQRGAGGGQRQNN
ncbi:MAG: hypothetical protein ACOVNY_07080 [Chitinophagaceae bacterium]